MTAGSLFADFAAFADAATLAALGCVALMGYAVQRGATCTVAAVDELLHERRATRLVAMLEAALWVAGGLLVAQALGVGPALPDGYAAGSRTVAGALLLGFGAWLAGACVFGAIARLGSGDWAHAATPLGYYAGCLALQAAAAPALPATGGAASPLLAAGDVPALAFAAFVLWRGTGALLAPRAASLAQRVWAPHQATGVIGLTFLATLLLTGSSWAYTDLLADLARGHAVDVARRSALFAALLAGAALGGWTAGRWRAIAPRPAALARCFAGGALMGCGTLLIPGSNDGLILVGMPLLQPYAWLAFATMVLTIATLMAARSGAARAAS